MVATTKHLPALLSALLLASPPLTCSALISTVGNQPVPGLKNGMDYVKLGSSELVVSKVCMGTMTFGEVREALFAFVLAVVYDSPLL